MTAAQQDPAGMQPGIHWPYCIDTRCGGCMPALSPPLPPTCAPALGLHTQHCPCPTQTKKVP